MKNAQHFMKIDYEWLTLIGTQQIGKDSFQFNHVMLFLMSLIDSLSKNAQNGCFASNDNLAKTLKIDKSSVSKYLQKLKKLGFIKTHEERDSGSRKTTRRFIYLQRDKIDEYIKVMNDDEI